MRDELVWRDAAMIERQRPILRAVRRYFRAEFRLEKQVPRTGPMMIVSNHSGGPMLPDLWCAFGWAVEHFGADAPLYGLIHDLPLRIPVVGPWMRRFGAVRACRANAAAVLQQSGVVVVTPGGDADAVRHFRARNTVDFGGRDGFAEVALRHGCTLVPTVNIGGHEVYFVLGSSERLAQWTGLRRRLRIHSVPIVAGLPWGIWPTGFVPFAPLPSKIVYRLCAPIEVPKTESPTKEAVAALAAQVQRTMQDALDDLATERRWPVIG